MAISRLSPSSRRSVEALLVQLVRRRLVALLGRELGQDVERARLDELVADRLRQLERAPGELARPLAVGLLVLAARHHEPADLLERLRLELDVARLRASSSACSKAGFACG